MTNGEVAAYPHQLRFPLTAHPYHASSIMPVNLHSLTQGQRSSRADSRCQQRCQKRGEDFEHPKWSKDGFVHETRWRDDHHLYPVCPKADILYICFAKVHYHLPTVYCRGRDRLSYVRTSAQSSILFIS